MEAVSRGLCQAQQWIHIPADQWDQMTLTIETSVSESLQWPIHQRGWGNMPYQACVMMKDDVVRMMEDEVVPKTSLTHSLSWLNRTCQALPCPNWSSYRQADRTRRHTRGTMAHVSADDSMKATKPRSMTQQMIPQGLRGPEAGGWTPSQ
jgi:hypothetical protein